MNRRWIAPLVYAVIALASLASAWNLMAHEAPGEESTALALRQPLPDLPGKTGLMIVVSYAPGQASKAHVHPGSVFAYVLEGEVTSQLEGQPPVTYRAGQAWYEPPRVPHLVSRNASDTAPARLLALLIVDDGAPPKQPWPK